MPPTTIQVVMKEVTNPDGDTAWTILPVDSKANEARFKPHKKNIKDKWADRNPKKARPDHLPIVFNEGDTLEFSNAAGLEFGIGVKKNSDVDEFPGAPDNPLNGWPSVKPIPAGATASATVATTPASGPGPKHQGFYKFHGWVKLSSGDLIAVDPDGYCGG